MSDRDDDADTANSESVTEPEQASSKRRRRKVLPVDKSGADILDRFTDPVKRKKKLTKEEKEDRERREKFIKEGKLFAKDLFNQPLTADEYAKLSPFVRNPLSIEELRKLSEGIDPEQSDRIAYTRLPNPVGLQAVMDFLRAATHCQQWIQAELPKLGWTQNMTGYNPLSASCSTREVLMSTMECYHMACKQMQRFLEYGESQTATK